MRRADGLGVIAEGGDGGMTDWEGAAGAAGKGFAVSGGGGSGDIGRPSFESVMILALSMLPSLRSNLLSLRP